MKSIIMLTVLSVFLLSGTLFATNEESVTTSVDLAYSDFIDEVGNDVTVERARKPVGGFDMKGCIKQCKKDNAADGTIGNLDVYCKTKCKFKKIFSDAGMGTIAR